MDRIQQNTPATISVTFNVDGAPADPSPDTATIRITRDDGTDLVATTAATPAGTGGFEYQLTATDTAQLDWLTAAWTATFNGNQVTVTTRLEVVGGFLFSLAQARADSALQDDTKYPTEKILEARTYAEQELEQACGVAFVPRYTRQSIDPGYGTEIQLGPKLRTLRSLQRGTTVFSTATATWTPGGMLRLGNLLPTVTVGSTAVDVAYEHGWDQPPAAVSRAALQLARDYLIKGPVDDRAIQLPTEDGPIFIATPGFQGKRFGIPAVDAVVTAYGYHSTVGSIPVTT